MTERGICRSRAMVAQGVAGDIEGQRTGKADGAGDLAQVVADACLGVVVLLII